MGLKWVYHFTSRGMQPPKWVCGQGTGPIVQSSLEGSKLFKKSNSTYDILKDYTLKKT